MATLRQYFETDFGHAARVYVRFLDPLDNEIESVILYDFSGFIAYMSCYVPGSAHDLEYFVALVSRIENSRTEFEIDGRVTLPLAREFPGKLRLENKREFEILYQFYGDPEWGSTKNIKSSTRVFIYSEAQLSESDVVKLKAEACTLGQDVQIRSSRYVTARSAHEKPLAFICHDSRDKEEVARKVAIGLQKMMCPVWYDEYSLKVGDSLRESIEKGLINCKKCILILSSNFLSNKGWTKKEFESVFTREILEERRFILPIWHNVTKEQVFDCSPSLLDVKGLSWSELGEAEVCRRLNRAITDQ